MQKSNTHNPKLTPTARALRKNMTEQERKLWYCFLKDHKYKFYRQRVIDNYIVDFYCHAAKLAIELDGSQHYESSGMLKDKIRTAKIEEHGITVIRIPNNEIDRNFRAVCDYVNELTTELLNKGKD